MGRCYSGLSADDDLLSAIDVHRKTVKRFEGVVDYEELSMVSMSFMQGQDDILIGHCSQGNRGSMRLAQESGECSWDNG